MLPHHILGLMAGARPAAADKAIKTVHTTTTQTTTATTEITHYVATDVVHVVTSTQTITPVTETVTGLEFASASTTTETVTGLKFASASTKASKPGAADIISSVDPRDLSPPSSIIFKDVAPVMAGVGADRASSDELLTSTFVPVNTETFLPSRTKTVFQTTTVSTVTVTAKRFDIFPVTPSVILPSVSTEPTPTTTTTVTVNQFEIVPVTPTVILASVSAEPTVTSTDTVVDATTTTKHHIRTKTFLNPTVKYVVATGEASQTTQPPKIFRVIASLIRK